MRKLILGALLSCAVFSAHADSFGNLDTSMDFVKVTRAIPACWETSEEKIDHCIPTTLKVGELLAIQDSLLVPGHQGLIRFWHKACPGVDHGCVPAYFPVWVSKDDALHVFKPVPMPKGARTVVHTSRSTCSDGLLALQGPSATLFAVNCTQSCTPAFGRVRRLPC
jgi:hypothetical protein